VSRRKGKKKGKRRASKPHSYPNYIHLYTQTVPLFKLKTVGDRSFCSTRPRTSHFLPFHILVVHRPAVRPFLTLFLLCFVFQLCFVFLFLLCFLFLFLLCFLFLFLLCFLFLPLLCFLTYLGHSFR